MNALCSHKIPGTAAHSSATCGPPGALKKHEYIRLLIGKHHYPLRHHSSVVAAHENALMQSARAGRTHACRSTAHLSLLSAHLPLNKIPPRGIRCLNTLYCSAHRVTVDPVLPPPIRPVSKTVHFPPFHPLLPTHHMQSSRLKEQQESLLNAIPWCPMAPPGRSKAGKMWYVCQDGPLAQCDLSARTFCG